MPSSEFGEYMDQIAARIFDFLKPHGFKKRHYTFNRWTKDGLCHVFDLQMGLRSLHGQFTANIGVFVPEVYRSLMGKDPPEFARVGECMINARFSDFTDEEDKWWDITPYPDAVVQELIDLLQTYGLPLFIKFPDRQLIIDGLLPFDEKYCVSTRPKLDIALVLENMGRHEEAQKMFSRHYQEKDNNEAHIKFLKNLAAQHNWDIKK